MNLKRMLRMSSIASGIGVAGIFGATIATANAAPTPCGAQTCPPGSQSAGPTVKLGHHQRKEVAKQAEKQAKGKQEVAPASTSHTH
jgi:Flp pilus assembly protein CpaB